MSERQIKTYLGRIGSNDPNKDLFISTIMPSLKGISSQSETSTQNMDTTSFKYSCPICEINNHAIIPTTTTTTTTKTSFLNTFSTYYAYIRHLTEKHSSLLPCKGRIFSSSNNNNNNNEYTSISDEFTCATSSSSPNDDNNNNNNKEVMKIVAKTLFNCFDCNQSFSRNEHLKKHLISQKHILNMKNATTNTQRVIDICDSNVQSCVRGDVDCDEKIKNGFNVVNFVGVEDVENEEEDEDILSHHDRDFAATGTISSCEEDYDEDDDDKDNDDNDYDKKDNDDDVDDDVDDIDKDNDDDDDDDDDDDHSASATSLYSHNSYRSSSSTCFKCSSQYIRTEAFIDSQSRQSKLGRSISMTNLNRLTDDYNGSSQKCMSRRSSSSNECPLSESSESTSSSISSTFRKRKISNVTRTSKIKRTADPKHSAAILSNVDFERNDADHANENDDCSCSQMVDQSCLNDRKRKFCELIELEWCDDDDDEEVEYDDHNDDCLLAKHLDEYESRCKRNKSQAD